MRRPSLLVGRVTTTLLMIIATETQPKHRTQTHR